MTALDIGIASFPALLVLIFLRVPIGLAMFVVGFVGSWLVTGQIGMGLNRLKSETFTTFSNYSLSIVPIFLLMGQFATLGGLSTALFKAAEGWLGHRRGGIAMASVGACAGFGAICGSSLATAATMGRVALPQLRKHGYSGGFSSATLAAGGTLGILIPPSVILVIYAILTEQNIAKLFLAAFVPGLLAAIGYMIAIRIYVQLNPHSAGTKARVPYAERLRDLWAVTPVLAIFVVVVGGIYSGLFTPTEGASIGALGTAVVAWANGGLTWATLTDSFQITAKSTAMIFFIILGAAFYNGFLALTQLPQELAAWVGAQGFSPWVVLILILVFYLLLGCLMDSLSMILLTIPIFWPMVQGLDFNLITMADLHAAKAHAALANGVDIAPAMLADIKAALAQGVELTRDQIKALEIRGVSKGALNRAATEQLAIWFGILVLIVVEVGLITPPVGMNLFVINAMDKTTPMAATYRAVIYFIASDILRVALLVAFPVITLVFVGL